MITEINLIFRTIIYYYIIYGIIRNDYVIVSTSRILERIWRVKPSVINYNGQPGLS